MARTIAIQGSPDGEVMAPLGTGETLFRGKHQKIRITEVGPDEETPLEVREALVGLTTFIIFTEKQLTEQGADLGIPEGSALSYGDEVILSLKEADKDVEADLLKRQITSDLCMYVFEPSTFEIVED